MVKNIAWALVDYTKHDKKFENQNNKEKFTLKSHQKVRIEDLLQIFIDDLELVKQFLEFVITDIGNSNPKELDALTNINLHHRMLEYYLYSKQMNEKTQIQSMHLNMRGQTDLKSFKNKIEQFINNYDTKIDKNYILFLFQIYNYSEGVRICCNSLGLKQELLNYYIQHDDNTMVMQVCKDATINDASSAGDLWI